MTVTGSLHLFYLIIIKNKSPYEALISSPQSPAPPVSQFSSRTSQPQAKLFSYAGQFS